MPLEVPFIKNTSDGPLTFSGKFHGAHLPLLSTNFQSNIIYGVKMPVWALKYAYGTTVATLPSVMIFLT